MQKQKDVGDEVLARDITYNVAKKLISDGVADGVYRGGKKLLILLFIISLIVGLFRLVLLAGT